MKKLLTIMVPVLLTATVWAQSPQKMSYQAVIRNSSGALVSNTQIGMQINIRQGSPTGTIVYTETQTPTTNANGLLSIEIGGGAGFNAINWANGPYFIETKTDIAGGTNYTIMGTSQLLSVPYALHAKTAETITETDPLWSASPSFGITNSNITNWNTAFGWGNHSGLYRPVSWVPSWADVTGKPTTFTPSAHSHSAADITSGTLDIGRIPTGTSSTTVALGNHTHGNITTDGKIGTSEGRIVTTGTGGTLQATAGTAIGQMLYWNGTAWVNIPPGNTGNVLTMINGVPTWGGPGIGMGADDVYNPITGRIWMDRNLGATQVATSSTDANSYGHLYQWGRGNDGHQIRTSGTTTTLSSTDAPGHANFILAPSSPYDWRSPQNSNLWQGVSGINNPCPSGYRLPTEAELNAERASWSSQNSAGAFASPLKLPVAGNRNFSNGSLGNVGSNGYYWSSTVAGGTARLLSFYSTDASMGSSYRAFGFSVRCIKN